MLIILLRIFFFFFVFHECNVLIVAIMKGTSLSDLNPRSNLIEGE
jgi:hypothetical protein